MTIHSDLKLLHPKFARAAIELDKLCRLGYEAGRTQTLFKVFETFRDPRRQNELFSKGASKARQFNSAHQFGLAVDMVPYLSAEEAATLGERIGERVFPGWNWHSSHDYAFLKANAEKVGLVRPLEWDLVHIEHPQWAYLQEWISSKIAVIANN